jgi:hypothetical protein
MLSSVELSPSPSQVYQYYLLILASNSDLKLGQQIKISSLAQIGVAAHCNDSVSVFQLQEYGNLILRLLKCILYNIEASADHNFDYNVWKLPNK